MAQVRREGERGGGSFPEARDIWGGGASIKNTENGVPESRWLFYDLKYA